MANLSIAKKTNQYTKNGGVQFVYTLNGTEEQIAEYKTSQGEFYRESEDKKPLYFSKRICNEGDELTKTHNGRFQVLQDLESVAIAIDNQTNKQLGNFNAMMQFAGLTKAQMQEKLMEKMFS